MKRRILHRRTMLRGAAGGLLAAAALPTLEMMLNGNGTAYADGTPIPVRFGIWYWGSGVRKDLFFPQTTGTDWESTPELAPLQGVRSELNVLGGYSVKEGGIVHHVGTAVLKTGQRYVSRGGGEFNTDVATHSFDVDVARHLGAGSPFPALHVGVYSDGRFNGEGLNVRALSHNGPDSPNMAETSPQALFDRLFAMTPPATPDTDPFPATNHRMSVLDLVAEEAKSLRLRLGTADQARIDAHLEAIAGIERRLTTMPPPGTTVCAPPSRPTQVSPPLRDPDMVLHNQLMVDLTALALACDLTRVFTFRHHGWTDDPVFSDLGARATHHNTTHSEAGDQPIVHAIDVFTMGQLAKMIERLRSVAIGDGTLLDHSAIMAYSEVGEGQSHSLNDIPILTIGRAGGALRTGLYHRSTTRESVTKVNLTMMRAVGMAAASFGEGPHQVTDPVSEIMA
jgi:hypothetical protein